MKKIFLSFCAATIILASCKKKAEPTVVEAEITPIEATTDTVANADSTNIQYEYEVNEVKNTTTEKGNSTTVQLNENDKYFIITGSFEARDRADIYVEILNKAGRKAIIVQRDRGLNMEYYRVAIQSSTKRSEAFQALEQLSSEFPQAWILIK